MRPHQYQPDSEIIFSRNIPMDNQATYYVFHNNTLLVQKNDYDFKPLTESGWLSLQPEAREIIDLEPQGPRPTYAVEVNADYDPGPDFHFINLRSLVGTLGDEQFNQWSRAYQLLNWLSSHRYCGRCGAGTAEHQTELARICHSCNQTYYPRIAPCIIVLISRGDKVLLARAEKFTNKMYSTLAGFIEPGESAEAALHREVYEEVGIRVQNLSYFGSQSWPFPGQLMLGFFAEYASGGIKVDNVEIIDAQWFPVSDLPLIPGKGTIAGDLIRTHAARIKHE